MQDKCNSVELLVLHEYLCMRELINISEINLKAWDNNLQSLEFWIIGGKKKNQ